jgi:hypothetical protein
MTAAVMGGGWRKKGEVVRHVGVSSVHLTHVYGVSCRYPTCVNYLEDLKMTQM